MVAAARVFSKSERYFSEPRKESSSSLASRKVAMPVTERFGPLGDGHRRSSAMSERVITGIFDLRFSICDLKKGSFNRKFQIANRKSRSLCGRRRRCRRGRRRGGRGAAAARLVLGVQRGDDGGADVDLVVHEQHVPSVQKHLE